VQGGGVSQNCGSVFSLWAAKALRSSETRTHPRPRHWIRGSRCWRRPARRGQLAPSCSKTAWSAQHADRLARCFLGAAKGKVEQRRVKKNIWPRANFFTFHIYAKRVMRGTCATKKIGFLDQPKVGITLAAHGGQARAPFHPLHVSEIAQERAGGCWRRATGRGSWRPKAGCSPQSKSRKRETKREKRFVPGVPFDLQLPSTLNPWHTPSHTLNPKPHPQDSSLLYTHTHT